MNTLSLSSIFRDWLLGGGYERQSDMLKILRKIMTTVADIPAVLTEIKGQLVKIQAEIDAVFANTPLTPEGVAALDALKTFVQEFDDRIPDEPPVE